MNNAGINILNTSKRWLDLGEAVERFSNLPVISFTEDDKQYCTFRIYMKEDESYYIPYLYLEDNKWYIEWISTEGDGILVVNGKNIQDVIDKAWDYINNKFKNNL